MKSRSAVPVLAFAVLGLLAGCNLPSPQADPVRHFTLSSPSSGEAPADAVSVRPVRLAGHLRGRAMAVRVSENEVTYWEDVRWAEPLDEAITSVLRNRLRQVSADAVVTVQIQRCELVQPAANAVQLSATYSIAPATGAAKSGTFTSSARTWTGGDHAALVGQIKEAVGELADALAAAVKE